MRWSPGEPTGLGAALWRMGSHSARGRTIGRPFGKRLPILPVSRSPLGEMEEDPPTFQQVSMFGPWLLVQRRRLASTLGADAGGGAWRLTVAWDGACPCYGADWASRQNGEKARYVRSTRAGGRASTSVCGTGPGLGLGPGV